MLKLTHVAIMRAFLLLSTIFGLSSAFVAPTSRIQPRGLDTSLNPKFDPSTEKWEPSSDADLEGAYSPFGSLIRAGPKPFFIRLINPSEYEQAVYKYMANENVGRKEAQGNMDAYFENAQDWAYQKNVERNGGYKKDYAADPGPQQLVLIAIWSGIVVWFFTDLINGVNSGKYY